MLSKNQEPCWVFDSRQTYFFPQSKKKLHRKIPNLQGGVPHMRARNMRIFCINKFKRTKVQRLLLLLLLRKTLVRSKTRGIRKLIRVQFDVLIAFDRFFWSPFFNRGIKGIGTSGPEPIWKFDTRMKKTTTGCAAGWTVAYWCREAVERWKRPMP